MVLEKIIKSLNLLDPKSKFLVKTFAVVRIFIVVLDTIGVVLIGLLVANSTNQMSNVSSSKVVELFSFVKVIENLSLIQIGFMALFLFTFKSALAIIFTRIMSKLLASAESKIASDTFSKLINGKYQSISKYSRQDLIYSLTLSASQGVTELISTSVTMLSEIALLISMAILFLFVDFKVAFGIILYFGLIGFAMHRIIGPKMQKIGKLYNESVVKSNSAIDDAVVAFREMTTLHKQKEFTSKFSEGRFGIAKPVADVAFYYGLPRYIIETMLMFGAVILAIYLFKNYDSSTAAGILGIFLTGSVRVMASMLPLQNALSNLRIMIAKSNPFFEVVQSVNKNTPITEKLNKFSTKDTRPVSVSFENVTFKYPNSDNFALKNISFEIRESEYIALIGPSGSGKSTIADLLIGLVEPTSGKVNYTNVDFQDAKIGYVPQTPGIVSGTILENITLNVNSKDFDQVSLSAALKGAHLNELIQSLENGVNTDLGAQLDGLSGGQMQRIGLARALYSQPGLLVLDEATSALDAETESAVAESLNRLKGSCSIVVIAHRLSTVQNADCVYVIDSGKIVASGKFGELAQTNELVAKYVELSEIRKN